MTLKTTAAHSSRVRKASSSSRRPSLLKRASSSSHAFPSSRSTPFSSLTCTSTSGSTARSTPFSTLPRRKPLSSAPQSKTLTLPRSQSLPSSSTSTPPPPPPPPHCVIRPSTNPEPPSTPCTPARQTHQDESRRAQFRDHSHDDERLPDHGLVHILTTDLTLRDVPQAMMYIQTRMFSCIPAVRSGMNSVRIAEVLGYRARVPRVVTVSHVQVLLCSATVVAREVAEMVARGMVRRVVVGRKGRGRKGGMEELLVMGRELEELVQGSEQLEEGIKMRFRQLLKERPSALRVSAEQFAVGADIAALIHAGFLTNSLESWTPTDIFSQPGDASRGTATSLHAISRAASGSLAAVGGEGAIHAAGGSAGGGTTTRRGDSGSSSSSSSSISRGEYSIAVPGMGAYLKLVEAACEDLVKLVSKSRFREVPEGFLREQWDGHGMGEGPADGVARRPRGDFTGVMPGRTRKWRVFWGVRFEWVLGECVGRGLVEVFETGSVGRGVRVVV